MQLLAVALSSIVLWGMAPAWAEIAELDEPLWEEVPGTIPQNSVEEYPQPIYADVNSLVADGAIHTFDIVNPDASYNRVQVNCETLQLRAIRLGFFESRTRVNYEEIMDSWRDANDEYDEALVNFVCAP